LRDLAGAIAGWRGEGRPVLVHCVRAESRTPTVAAAYLAERFGMSGADALARAREVLPSARPNAGFRAALERMWPEVR
jgi:protein-tyrosine phosphatase